MPHLSIRIDFDDEGRLGPGKVALLEQIEREGSISAAGRAMNMSYKRAWELVSEINRTFEEPLVTAQTGGRAGGGAALTPRGQELIRQARQLGFVKPGNGFFTVSRMISPPNLKLWLPAHPLRV